MAHKIEPFISMVFVVPGLFLFFLFFFFFPFPPGRLSWAEISAPWRYQLTRRSKENLDRASQAKLLGLITDGKR